MEGIRTFLESSTIHGLSYISTTQKYARLFWTLVVISGFTVAFLIIEESFISWSESPVKTTLETLPISELTFPKVTVCPPKNTYTDLNYDLMLTANMTLTEAMRDEIFEYAFEVLTENTFPMTNWSKLHEEDRGYNWYHGHTQIKSPRYSYDYFDAGRSCCSAESCESEKYVNSGHLEDFVILAIFKILMICVGNV